VLTWTGDARAPLDSRWPTRGFETGKHGCRESKGGAQMGTPALREEIAGFFDGFVKAFISFSGAGIASLYFVPCFFLARDGSIQCLQSRADIEGFFRDAVDAYYGEGCRDIRFRELEVVPMGGRSVLGTVTWELLREDGSVLRQWRQSYNLVRVEKGLRIYCSTQHVG
jgi:hypothetical protein